MLRVDIANCAALTDESDTSNAVYSVLAMTLGVIGISTITAENVDRVIDRYRVYQALHGGLLVSTNEDGSYETIIIGREHIEPWVGMTTNWGFTLTRAQFLKNVTQDFNL